MFVFHCPPSALSIHRWLWNSGAVWKQTGVTMNLLHKNLPSERIKCCLSISVNVEKRIEKYLFFIYMWMWAQSPQVVSGNPLSTGDVSLCILGRDKAPFNLRTTTLLETIRKWTKTRSGSKNASSNLWLRVPNLRVCWDFSVSKCVTQLQSSSVLLLHTKFSLWET